MKQAKNPIGRRRGDITADAWYALGADVTTLNAREDGRFSDRPSEPTAETCADMYAYVADVGINIGVTHDGDAGRVLAVTEEGDFLDVDVLLTLFAQQETTVGDRITTSAHTGLADDGALAPIGATVSRTPVGDVYVAERATEADVVFGEEPSGAWIWPEETLCPDGPLAAVKLAGLVAGPLSKLAADIDYPLRRYSIEVDPDVIARITSAEITGPNSTR